jgi:monoamine oxidase
MCYTDLFVERLWDYSHIQEGKSGILLPYIQAKNADTFAAIPNDQRDGAMLDEIAKFYPAIKTQATVVQHKVWGEDPYALGGWHIIPPGGWWIQDVIAKPENRVHFAGEHTSFFRRSVEGAVESGKRATFEVLLTPA